MITEVFEQAEVKAPEGAKKALIVVSSDRGLCGAIHSSVSKAAKKELKAASDLPVVVLGDKAKVQISRDYRKNIQLSFNGLGKAVPNFLEAAAIAERIAEAKVKPDVAVIIYNEFKSVIAYEAKQLKTFTDNIMNDAGKFFRSSEIEKWTEAWGKKQQI